MTVHAALPRLAIDRLVLCYHALSDDWPLPMAVSPAQLEREVSVLLRRGYRPATFHDALFSPPGRRTFAVTFDDGFRSVFRRGFPVLQQLGVPATVFVPTDQTDSGALRTWPQLDRWLGTPYEAELEGMSWRELDELRRAGWEVGSHTLSHARLSALSDSDLERELRESRLCCEDRLQASCHTLAYPYGAVDARVVEATRAAGYAAAAGLGAWGPKPDPFVWPRVIMLEGRDARFVAATSPWRRRVTASPAWPVLQPLARSTRRLMRR